MAVQNSGNLTTQPFVRGGEPRVLSGTFVQDAQRSGAVVAYTLLAKYVSGANVGKWTTFTDETATDGTQYPAGISVRAITEAAVQAGDVSDYDIYYMGPFSFDQAQLTIENSKTLATEITSPSGIDVNVKDVLLKIGLIPVSVTDVDAYENA